MEKNKKTPPKKTGTSAKPVDPQIKTNAPAKVGEFAFGKENYRLMLLGLVFIMVGFLLMIGGGSEDPNVFNPDIFSFRRITLAPMLVLAGYAIEIYAIMKKPKD